MFVTAADYKRVKAVFLDGENVTADCVEADNIEGWVKILRKNEAGAIIVEGNDPVIDKVYGEVIIYLNININAASNAAKIHKTNSVLFNGENVTDVIRVADSIDGYIIRPLKLFGFDFTQDGEQVTERLTGKVEIIAR